MIAAQALVASFVVPGEASHQFLIVAGAETISDVGQELVSSTSAQGRSLTAVVGNDDVAVLAACPGESVGRCDGHSLAHVTIPFTVTGRQYGQPRMLNLLLARHAQSEWNAVGRWQGQADPPLSELGRAQARAAGFNAGVFDAIVASTLERALHTATVISEATGVGPVLADERLMERHAGDYQGLTRDEIETRWPGNLASRIWPSGWEPNDELITRAFLAMDEIHVRTGGVGEVLVVTHGGLIYSIEEHLGEDRGRIPNLGGCWVHHDGNRWRLGERIELAPDNITLDSDRDTV